MSGLIPEVTIGDAPAAPAPMPAPRSPLVQRDPNRVEYATDDQGRAIGVRELNALDRFELSILLGENSGNPAAMNQALIASSVVSISGRQVSRPISIMELKARIGELNFTGYAAAAKAMAAFSSENEAGAAAVKNS